jgi:hypothetical protein
MRTQDRAGRAGTRRRVDREATRWASRDDTLARRAPVKECAAAACTSSAASAALIKQPRRAMGYA